MQERSERLKSLQEDPSRSYHVMQSWSGRRPKCFREPDDPDAQILFGDHGAPESERGIRVQGTPLGSNALVRAQLQAIGESHELLLSRIPAIQDLQSAWLLLLFCAATRAFSLRVCHPEHSVHFVHQHDIGVWQCFYSLLGQPLPTAVWEVSSLTLRLSGLELWSASRTIHAASWGSWADCLSTIWHANIAQTMARTFDSLPETAIHLVGAARSRATLASEGVESPSTKDCALNSLRLTRWNQVFLLRMAVSRSKGC